MNIKCKAKNILENVCPPVLRMAQYLYKPYRLYYKIKGNILSQDDFYERLTGSNRLYLTKLYNDILSNHDLFYNINKNYVAIRGRRTDFSSWTYLLYAIIRTVKPEVVLETGVFDGHSSTIILQALKDNDNGHLVSIDLPAEEVIQDSTSGIPDGSLPAGEKPGWMIPDNLRDRHELLLGDSRTLLPQVLAELGKISVFLHDSLHTFDHMLFEYKTAYPYLEPNGLLLTDDAWANYAFVYFCRTFREKGYVTGDFGGILCKDKAHEHV